MVSELDQGIHSVLKERAHQLARLSEKGSQGAHIALR